MGNVAERFRPGSIDYDGVMSTHFDAGRPMHADSAEAWRQAISQRLDPQAPRRVLDLGSGTGRGVVLLRGKFAERLDGMTLFQFFPGARRIAEAFPSVDDLAAAFEPAGFAVEALDEIQQPSFARMAEMVDSVRLRADTTLALMDDREFAQGLEALEQAALAQPDVPVIDVVELLTFRLLG